MNVLITKSAPEGVFEEVSTQDQGWQERFESLIRERKNIRFGVHTMPAISQHILDALNKHRYVYVIEESHADQLFLLPVGSKID
jgi:hypothetical protein